MALTVLDIDGPPLKAHGGTEGLAVVTKKVTFDAAYAAGGEALTPEDFGLDSILILLADPVSVDGYVCRYDYDNEKLMAFFGNYDAADGPLIEASGNLSATILRVTAIGVPA